MATRTLLDIIGAASNDYGSLINKPAGRLPSLTVIVAWYRGEMFLPFLAEGLNAQTDRDFELVLVDDDPTHPLTEEALTAFTKRPTVLRHDRNHASPCAKNTGLAFARTDAVLFLDQDMVLPAHAIGSFRRALARSEQVVALGFRGTLQPEARALGSARLPDDWRHTVTPDASYLPAMAASPHGCGEPELRTYHLLEETDGFRGFGCGRVVGFWDLPVMVVGHTLAASTALLRAAGGFPEQLVGWGTDDTALGAYLIAAGAMIVPMTDVVSTQVEHRPWSGSRKIQLSELGQNLDRYRRMLASPARLDQPAERRFSRVGNSYRVELREEPGR